MNPRKGYGGKTVYGARVGILMLDTKWPRPPGDTGNAQVLCRRLRWRGFDAEVVPVGLGEPVPSTLDLYLLGGGEAGLVPCHRGFWLDGLWFDVFPTRHHLPQTSFGLALGGSFAYTGDTRPVPEMLARYAAGTELIAHDCGLVGNPSHTGIDDIEREYPHSLRPRLRLYHYGSADDGAALAARGYVTASTGERIALPSPTPPRPDAG